eukprot:3028019-Ditylum_brightwellii.AAC.2
MKYSWKHGCWDVIFHVMNNHKDEHHVCGLDNLYMSANFSKMALKRNVHVHGVTRKCGHGVPSCALQEKVASRSGQIAVRGTVNAVILCGDAECGGLLDVSAYNAKPVQFLATANRAIKWVKKKREVYLKKLGKK